jgi:hypothetical protein
MSCTNCPSTTLGTGGCTGNCFCDKTVSAVTPCKTDADCTAGQLCASSTAVATGGVCVTPC